MLDKFKQNPLRRFRQNPLHWHRLSSLPALDRARVGVVRHRIASRLDSRRRATVAGAVALAAIGLGGVTLNAAEPADPATTHSAAEATRLFAERQAAADRADRGTRTEFSVPAPLGRAAAVQASPTPTKAPPPEEAAPEEAAAAPETTAAAAAEPAPDWVHPMPESRTTSCFGYRWGAMHGGVDLAAPEGTPIYAAGAGTVTHAGWAFGGYGISVVIDHHNGHYTHYAHASEALVKPGDKVEPGQQIAREGNTGDSTGPHLHFEVHKGSLWNHVEPTQWMSNRGVQIGGC